MIEWSPIIAAAIVGGLALIGTIWQSRKTRGLNSFEHAENAAKLERIETKIDITSDHVGRVSDRLDEHLSNHARRRWFDR